MKITKELHDFLRDIIIYKKPIEWRFSEYVPDNDWVSNIDLEYVLKWDFEHSKPSYSDNYDLRIKKDNRDIQYRYGDRFKHVGGAIYILHKINQVIEYCENGTADVYNTFSLFSLREGLYYGSSFTVRNKEFLTEDEFLNLSSDTFNTKFLTKIN